MIWYTHQHQNRFFKPRILTFSKDPSPLWKELAARDIIWTEVSERMQLFPAFTPYVILHCSGEKSTPGVKFKYICCWYFATGKVRIPYMFCWQLFFHCTPCLLFVNFLLHFKNTSFGVRIQDFLPKTSYFNRCQIPTTRFQIAGPDTIWIETLLGLRSKRRCQRFYRQTDDVASF